MIGEEGFIVDRGNYIREEVRCVKSKKKFYKKWSIARSKGIFKYLLKDIISYILVIVIGILLKQ